MSEQRTTETMGAPLTWDDLANLFDQRHSVSKARTLPMDMVAKWAESQPDIVVGADDSFYRRAK
jgi:hypothetical protein